MKKGLIITLIIVLCLGGGLLIRALLLPLHTLQQGTDMAYGVVDQVLDSEQAIRDYEWFKQQEADIRKCLENEVIAQSAYDDFVQYLPEDRTTWSDFDKREEASLRNAITALQKVTNNAIEDYNARSEMVNHAIFKDNLPTNISRAWYAAGNLITQ